MVHRVRRPGGIQQLIIIGPRCAVAATCCAVFAALTVMWMQDVQDAGQPQHMHAHDPEEAPPADSATLTSAPARLLLVTLEHRFSTFSGNGVYSTSQARALRAAGHSVLVVCAAPGANLPKDVVDGQEVVIRVPEENWGSLQVDGPWQEFADGFERDATHAILDAVRRFAPDAVLAVDWHGYEAAQRLSVFMHSGDDPTRAHTASSVPIIALNYRVFSRESTTPRRVRELEARAAREAAVTVALSSPDEKELRLLGAVETTVVAPALRADVRAAAERVMVSPACMIAHQLALSNVRSRGCDDYTSIPILGPRQETNHQLFSHILAHICCEIQYFRVCFHRSASPDIMPITIASVAAAGSS